MGASVTKYTEKMTGITVVCNSSDDNNVRIHLSQNLFDTSESVRFCRNLRDVFSKSERHMYDC